MNIAFDNPKLDLVNMNAMYMRTFTKYPIRFKSYDQFHQLTTETDDLNFASVNEKGIWQFQAIGLVNINAYAKSDDN